ncbi:thiol:disulfide interchange protein DsbA/DsbL [Undibacterium luofuense]|uniref:thiol:disulfide interchange protein DsbA/DsbL n=1 Tax=Undibacterium luofuense TaxID=2828733 RepID=UPI0030EE4F29
MQIRRQFFRKTLMLGAGLLLAAGAIAAPNTPKAGVEYKVLGKPQPTEAGKKIEVIEFFGYFCPHCNALDPMLEAWLKKQGDKIVFKRVHVGFHGLTNQQKLYATLDIMGKLGTHHVKAFNAYHVERNRLQSEADVMKFVAASGLDQQKFKEVFNSFGVTGKIGRYNQLLNDYQIDSVPTIAIDGRFVTSPVQAVSTIGRVTEDEQNRAVLVVMDQLVNMVAKEKGLK